MEKAKKIYKSFLLILFIFITIWSLFVRVHADSNGTNTDGKWTNSHVTENLVELKSGTLTEQGWNITDEVKDAATSTDGDSNLKSFEDSYGIQARKGAAAYDIGAKNYTKGVWVRITLSDADIEKAKKGDLKVNASARYYKQDTANHYCSVQIFFEKKDGIDYVDVGNIYNKTKISKNGDVLTVSGDVPTDATSFRYYVSNWGSLAGRPFIGDLRCTLSDEIAPKMSSITFDNYYLTDQVNNVAITGNKLIYDLNFDEKIESIEYSTTYTGVATLKYEDGTNTNLTAKPTLIHEKGKSKVRYTFTLTSLKKSGKVYLSSINNLKVIDEAYNSTIVNGNVSSQKIQYYKNMTVTHNIENLDYEIPANAIYNTDLIAKLTPKTGYDLPTEIEVYVGTSKLTSTQYTYNNTNGDITINSRAITDDITIKASGVAKKITIIFDKKGGNGGSNSIEAIFDSDMPKITIPTRTGYTFLGYYENEDAQGKKFYNADGTSATICTKYTNITLYAAWESNTYSVIYDKNTPANASSEVTGIMANSKHTYDETKTLSSNLYLLEGYTFKGWSTSKNGSVVYNDEASILNLRESGSITLYAVWKANKYQIKYNPNKPLGSTGNIFGNMSNSNHTYDFTTALLDNVYSLNGYTFKGWSKSPKGTVDYKNGEKVSNLTNENGDVVNLYAVWEANTYTVRYNDNKPSGTSNTVSGSISDSIFTYDEMSSLNKNNYFIIGYTFKGWATSKNGTVVYSDNQTVRNLTSVDGGIVELYAVWEANEYSITFDNMGGSFANKMLIKYDEAFLEIIPPTRKGYNFEGYYTLPNGEGVKYYNNDGTAVFAKYNDDCDLTLYAKWSPIIYNIELYSRGEYIGSVKNVVYGYMRLPSCQDLGIAIANYDFVGWNIYEDQNWSMYNANVDYNTGLGEYDGQTIILHAAWLEKDIYSINYNANGGIGAPGMMQVHEDETIALSAFIPTRENYKFLGWSTNSDATTIEYLPGATFTMGNSLVTLYAVWELNPSLVYDANGGKFINQIEKLYHQEGSNVTITSVIPVLEGYIFIGWNENKDATTGIYNSGDIFTMPNTDTILYAIWKKAEYTITESVASGYVVSGLLSSYQYNDMVTFSVSGINPKVYVDGQLITPVNNVYSFIITKNTKLIVKDGSKVSLIYSGNGGINEPTDTNSYDINSNTLISTITPSRTGYQFIGWSTSKDSKIAEYNPGDSINFASEDIILYAVWEANSYRIIYDANGGTGTMSSDLLSYDTTFILSNNVYKNKGYTFQGWSLNPNGEKIYVDGDKVINLSSIQGDEVILYAIWKKTVTKINFVTVDGTEINMPFTIDYGADLNTDNLNKPSREGYIFLGYYTGINGTGDLMIDENLQSTLTNGWSQDVNSITLYSYWRPITYSIIYMNGQTICYEQIVSYDSNFNLISAILMGITAPVGYHFAGWSTMPSSKTVVYNDNQNITQALEKNDGSKVFLYAVFEINKKYNINYNANGGINAPIDDNTYYVGDIITIPSTIPTLEGYIFAGWSYDYGNDPIDFPYSNNIFTIPNLFMVEGGITLYAVWIEDKTLQSQINQVNLLIEQLQASIENINSTNDNLAENINQLTIKIQKAQDVLDSLDSTYVTYEVLNEAITNLKNELLLADNALQDAINTIQTNLDTAISNLNDTILNNKNDIEAKLNDVISAYELADSIINGKIQELVDKDTELNNLITSLEKAYKKADTSLQAAINTVQTNLDTAISNLNDTILNNKNDIEAKLNDVISAYELADSIINGKIQELVDKDTELNNLITSLEKAYKKADTSLQAAINTVQTNLDTAISNLNDTILNNKNDIEAKLNDVISAYELADSIINGKIQELVDKDTELNNLITSLEKAYKKADTSLQAAINTVQTNLDTAISNLNDTILNNKNDIEAKLNDVISAYELADSIINGKIQELVDKDTELNNLITSLEKAYKKADTSLQAAINTVQTNLDTAISNLNDTILNNKNDIEAKLNDVISAYELADSIINGKIQELVDKDTELNNLITSLEKAYKKADTSLQAAINTVQTNLDTAISNLNDTILNNKNDIETKLNDVINAYELADSVINCKIKELENKDDELNNLITALEKSYKEADNALRDAIDRVQTNLDTAIFNFSVVIVNNKNDIERKLNDVIKAYELADSVINGKIKRLENKDTELNNLITTLEKTYKEADVALQDAINILQTNLNNAVSDLNTSISNNKQEIKEELRVAKEAYDAANVVINSKFASLAEKDEDLLKLLNYLKQVSKNAEEKILEEINKLKEEMNQKDKELEESIQSLTETTNRDKKHLYILSYINLGLIIVLAVVAIFFGVSHRLCPTEKRKIKKQ